MISSFYTFFTYSALSGNFKNGGSCEDLRHIESLCYSADVTAMEASIFLRTASTSLSAQKP
jgi:hypothetical protein